MRGPAVIIAAPVRRWYCPNCPAEDRTQNAQPHTRFHPCPGLRGILAPMVEVGTRAKVYARDREDYVGSEIVTKDADGRPVMSVVTEREDGQDTAVFAPLATARIGVG